MEVPWLSFGKVLDFTVFHTSWHMTLNLHCVEWLQLVQVSVRAASVQVHM